MKKFVSILCSLAVLGSSAAYIGNSVNCEKAGAYKAESYNDKYFFNPECTEEGIGRMDSGFAYAVGADKVKLRDKIYTLEEYKNGVYKEEDQYKYYVEHNINGAILRNDIAYQLFSEIKKGSGVAGYWLEPLASYWNYGADAKFCMRLNNKYELIVMATDEKTLSELKERIEKEVKTTADKSTIKYEVNPDEVNEIYIGDFCNNIKFGDFDGNGEVDSKDAVYILQYYAQLFSGGVSKELRSMIDKTDDDDSKTIRFFGDYSHADANNDWVIDSKDAVKVLQDYAKELAKSKK